MAAIRPGRGKNNSLLARYGSQFAQLLEQRNAELALTNAQAQAQLNADTARLARGEAQLAAERLKNEQQRLSDAQSQLEHVRTHDKLTELPNRFYFNSLLEDAISDCRQTGVALALYYIDLDNFKDVNSILGQDAGDALLKHTAQKLRSCLQPRDVVARLGGDEFAVLVFRLVEPDSARRMAEQIVAALAIPSLIAGNTISATASIGVTLFPEDALDAAMMHRNADIAMQRCKQEGRHGYQFFGTTLDEEVKRRSSLEKALRAALRNGELSLAYQPQFCLLTWKLSGVEALLRWNSPEYGSISPDIFIPIAERTDLIAELGAWVLGEACRQMVVWDQQGLPPLSLAVNVSVPQLRLSSLPGLVETILRETNFPPARLELEITETEVMRDMQTSIDTLMKLRELGIKLAIDDFGTGYSSLNYLRRLTVDKIKIDKSFVADVVQNTDAATIAGTIVTLARNLRLSVVAEGVETAQQEAFLREIGCHFGQGYLYGKPVPALEFVENFTITRLAG